MEAPDDEAGNARVLRKEVVIAAPIDTVWRAWTTEEGLAVVSSRSRIDLTPGGEYSWFLDLEPDAHGRRGSEGSKIVSITAPREIVFDWTFPPVTPGLRESGATTRVEVQLRPVDPSRVAVRLSAHGWGAGEEWDVWNLAPSMHLKKTRLQRGNRVGSSMVCGIAGARQPAGRAGRRVTNRRGVGSHRRDWGAGCS